MSGKPGIGDEQVHTVPQVEVGSDAATPTDARARRRSTAIPGCIHGLIAYSTVKYVGGHMR